MGRPPGPPVEIPREKLLEALKYAAEGWSIRKICAKINIEPLQFFKFRKQDYSFTAAFQLARESGFEINADDLLDLADQYADPLTARVKSDNLRWLLSKRKPKEYGDQLNINIEQKISVGEALSEAKKRAGIESGEVIELTKSADTNEYLDEFINQQSQLPAPADDDIFS